MRLLLLFCLLFGPLAAQDPAPVETQNARLREQSRLVEEMNKEGDQGADFTGELAQLALSLGLILVALLALSWIVRRLLNKRVEETNLTSDIKVLEKRYLNPKAVIYLISIGNKNIIIGESPQGLVNLGEIRGDMSQFEKVMSQQS